MDNTVHERIRQEVADHPVVLYMKGSPVFPQCGFSAARMAGVPARVIGTVGGVALTLRGVGAISVDALKATNEAWLPDYMARV